MLCRLDDGSWINKVTYCGGQMDECKTEMITTVANVSMTRPGVVHHVYTDAPLDPQVGISSTLMHRWIHRWVFPLH